MLMEGPWGEVIRLILLLSFASEEERDAFSYLYSHYKEIMLQKANAILHDPMLAEDAVSEAFLRIYRNMRKIDDPASGRSAAFVLTIVRNTALTILRRENRQPNLAMEEDERADSFDLEEHVLSTLSKEQILRILDELNEELRSVFLLKYAYDLPHKKIGLLLGITENNVTVRLYRAKKKIAAALAKEGIAIEENR